MQAAFLAAPQELEIRSVEISGPAAAEAVLRVAACGICGSNLHGWRHPELSVSGSAQPGPGAAGHEVAGEIVALGSEVSALHTGQQVVVEPNLAGACLRCEDCAAGRFWFCRNRTEIAAWGFAEQMVVPAFSLFPVPPSLPAAVATLTEPLACAIHAIRASSVGLRAGGRIEGRRVAILGAGVTGLLTVVAARELGAEVVTVVARHDHQAAASAELGADQVFRPGSETAAELKATQPELIVEAVGGTSATLPLAMRAVVPGGEIAVLGLFDELQSFDARRAVFRELRMFFPVTYGVLDGRHDFDIALALLAADPGRYAPLITHHFPLGDIAAAFTTAADKRTGALRVVVEP